MPEYSRYVDPKEAPPKRPKPTKAPPSKKKPQPLPPEEEKKDKASKKGVRDNNAD